MATLTTVAIVERSTNKILNRNYMYYEFPALPTGFDNTTYEVVEIGEDITVPEPDYRLYSMEIEADVISTALTANGYRYVYNRYYLVPRSTAEIKQAILDAKNIANNQIYQADDRDTELYLCVAAIMRGSIVGVQLTDREIIAKDKVSELALKFAQNEDNYNALVAVVDAGQTPNIDLGWETA